MVVISISYLFDRGLSVCRADNTNLPLSPPPLSIFLTVRLLSWPVDHFIIGRGRVGEGKVWRGMMSPCLPGFVLLSLHSSAPTHSALLNLHAVRSRFVFHQYIIHFMNPNMMQTNNHPFQFRPFVSATCSLCCLPTR